MNCKKLLPILAMVLALIISISACSLVFTESEDKETQPETSDTQVDETSSQSTTAPQPTSAADTTAVESIDTDTGEDEFFDISTLTLEQKVAQMILVSCHEDVDIIDAAEKGVGGLCLYYLSFDGKDRDEVIDMIAAYQASANIPLIVSTDEEGGDVVRVSLNDILRAVPFWSPRDLYEEGGFDLVKSDTEEKADLLLSLGINVNLAPVCDVPLSEDNYIYDRTFSMDHNETGEYVSLVVSTMKEKGIGSTLKHFPGYGGSVDTHTNVGVDTREYSAFENGDFIPFIKGIESGADSVLVSHNIVNCMDPDMPASLSKPVHDILRNNLGFDGVILTDDLVMDAITQFTDGESSAVMAVMAGNDMLCCENYEEAISSIVNAVDEGLISEERINESVERIIRWKTDLNLL